MRLALLLLLVGCPRLPADPAAPDMDGDGYDAWIDCDDFDASIHPLAPETCDGVDSNCTGDETDAPDARDLYADTDGDGWGDVATATRGCEGASGAVTLPGDCDDQRADVYPGAPEPWCVPEDLNCDGRMTSVDADGDGSTSCEDCDDTNPRVHPHAEEVCDRVDNDCDGTADEGVDTVFWLDEDEDGWGVGDTATRACRTPGAQWARQSGDCDDFDAAAYPDAPETCDDGVDQDCDGEDLVCP